MLYVALAGIAGIVCVAYFFARTVQRTQRAYDRRESVVIAQMMDTFTRREDQLIAQIASLAGRTWQPATLYEPEPEIEREPEPWLVSSPEQLP